MAAWWVELTNATNRGREEFEKAAGLVVFGVAKRLGWGVECPSFQGDQFYGFYHGKSASKKTRETMFGIVAKQIPNFFWFALKHRDGLDTNLLIMGKLVGERSLEEQNFKLDLCFGGEFVWGLLLACGFITSASSFREVLVLPFFQPFPSSKSKSIFTKRTERLQLLVLHPSLTMPGFSEFSRRFGMTTGKKQWN